MRRRLVHRGLSLAELLIASSITTVIVGVLGAVAAGVHEGHAISQSEATLTQHARIALERIERAALAAHASEQFPAMLVISQKARSWNFPETLVVWRPRSEAVDPEGQPRWNELVVFAADPERPYRLLEITPANTQTAPAADNTTAWKTAIDQLLNAETAERVVLTDRLQTAAVGNGNAQLRGAVRFEVRLHPSDDDWRSYRNGDLQWDDLAWPQDMFSAKSGVRQVWMRTELQLTSEPGGADPQAQRALPFFGSAAIYYPLTREEGNL